jgi:hypothetical protein
MARGNDGNLLQHAIESELAGGLAGADSAPGLWLTCTHSMAPFEPFYRPPTEQGNQRQRFEHWWERALNIDEAAGPPVLRGYRCCRQGNRDGYPNSAEISSEIIGREHLAGTLVEFKDAKYHALVDRWSGTKVRIKQGSWRAALADLTAPADLDRPWLFTMDPFTYATRSNEDNGDLHPGDFQLLREPLRSWLDSSREGVFTAFCYAMLADVRDEYQAAMRRLRDDMEMPNVVVSFAELSAAGRFHVGALISKQAGLLEMACERWATLRDDARNWAFPNSTSS